MTLRRTVLTLALMIMALGGMRTTEASVVLSIQPEAPLDHLQIGDTVKIDLVLSGVSIDDPVVGLHALLVHDASTQTSNAEAGSIVPLSSGAFFLSSRDDGPLVGLTDVLYMKGWTGPGAITSNGVFASFWLQAVAPGIGSLGFSNLSIGWTSQGAPVQFGGPVLTDPGPTVPMPEPATPVLLISGGIAGLTAACGRRRRRGTAAHST